MRCSCAPLLTMDGGTLDWLGEQGCCREHFASPPRASCRCPGRAIGLGRLPASRAGNSSGEATGAANRGPGSVRHRSGGPSRETDTAWDI
jgi:hypothetical protein